MGYLRVCTIDRRRRQRPSRRARIIGQFRYDSGGTFGFVIGPPVYQPTPRCVLVPDRRCFHAARGYGRSDGDGNPIQIALDVRWAAAEPLARSKVSGNGWFPAEEKRDARVHTFSHGLSSSAVAQGSIVVDGTAYPMPADKPHDR